MSDSGSEFPPEVLERINRARVACSSVQARDPTFFAAVSKAMFERDPIGINFTDNTDEMHYLARGSRRVVPELAHKYAPRIGAKRALESQRPSEWRLTYKAVLRWLRSA